MATKTRRSYLLVEDHDGAILHYYYDTLDEVRRHLEGDDDFAQALGSDEEYDSKFVVFKVEGSSVEKIWFTARREGVKVTFQEVE